MQKYKGPYSAVNGTYGGCDALGRILTTDATLPLPRGNRSVGIFYYPAPGNHGLRGPYDNSKILAKDPHAPESEEAWLAAGGGPRHADHHWGEPLFGYYTMHDPWVLRKHIQLLTDAGIDYLIFDTTNAVTYDETVCKILAVLDEFYRQGVENVPKFAYYTNTASGRTINHIYHHIYKALPEYAHLWLRWDGRPMIIGHPDDPELEEDARAFFRIKATYWPTEPRKSDDQWPWIEFGGLYTPDAVYGMNGRKEVVSVSTAQHCQNIFSASAWYGAPNRTKSYRRESGENDPAPDAVQWGYNFADQWKWAIAQDPETVFVTQWNEWLAMRMDPMGGHPIAFVDLADPNNSRDIEPMRGGYGDNYYMQLCEFVRRYKGGAPRVDVGSNLTISVTGDFSQWDQATACYRDYARDTLPRDYEGFGRHRYTDCSGRNDFVWMKAARDAENLYFYVQTADPITPPGRNWMTLFLKSRSSDGRHWHGFNYAVNRTAAGVVEVCEGGWNWQTVGTAEFRIEGTQMMLRIPRRLLGLQDSLIDLEFKWADNYTEDDIWSFYEKGDTAPIGRLTYVFRETE